jgi:hypothetical protein
MPAKGVPVTTATLSSYDRLSWQLFNNTAGAIHKPCPSDAQHYVSVNSNLFICLESAFSSDRSVPVASALATRRSSLVRLSEHPAMAIWLIYALCVVLSVMHANAGRPQVRTAGAGAMPRVCYTSRSQHCRHVLYQHYQGLQCLSTCCCRGRGIYLMEPCRDYRIPAAAAVTQQTGVQSHLCLQQSTSLAVCSLCLVYAEFFMCQGLQAVAANSCTAVARTEWLLHC